MSKSLNILESGTAIGAALLLGACHPSGQSADGNTYALPALPATLPLAAGAATTPTYAPSVDALPAAPRLRTVRVADPRNAYAYADDAWDFGDAVFDAPPDYGFDYAGTEPWAWQGYDQSLTFVEPIDDGYRYYYYRPGADEPYFIRDADYGYGYDGDQLAVIYGPGGAILPYDSYGPRIDYASRYLARARNLYAASRQRERRAVNAANWAARAAAISAAQSRWAAERARQTQWHDYHQRVAPAADRHWQEERVRRQADAQRFAAWRQTDYRDAPPPRVIPAAWQQARWAHDNRRYVPVTAPRDLGAQQRRAQDQAARQQADRQRDFARQQRQAAAGQAGLAQRQQQALAQQQLRARNDQQRAAEMARAQGDRAARQAAAQQRAAMTSQHDAQRQQAQAQARNAQRAQMQARQAARAQVDAARAQAQAAARDQQRVRAQAAGAARVQAQRHARGQAEAQARAQAQAARARGQQQARAQAQAARAQAQQQARAQAQAARAQAQQQARSQAAGQARAQAQAARAQMQARAQAARAQAQAARAQAHAARAQPQPQHPAPQAPRPQAAPQQHGGGGNPGHGGHGHHPG